MEKVPVHLLNAFVTFNESQNIVKASESLGITQPALSKQLKALESKFPFPLFSVQGRKKILTRFGQGLYDKIKGQIGNIQETVQESVLLHSESRHAKIRISGRRGILDRISEKVKFQGTLIFNEASNQQVVDDMLSMKADIGVAYTFPNSFDLVAKPLFREEFKIAVPKKFLPQKRNFGKALLQELKVIPFIGFNSDDEVLKKIYSDCSLDCSSLKMSRITANYLSIARMVDAELGWAIVPSYIGIDEQRNRIIPVPSQSLDLRKFSILYRPDLSNAPWFKNLIEEIKSSF